MPILQPMFGVKLQPTSNGEKCWTVVHASCMLKLTDI